LAPDLIEAGDPYHPAWSALAAAERLGIPCVAFVHSNLSRMLASRFGGWTGNAAERYLRLLYERFDAVLAPSLTVAKDLWAAGVPRVEVQRLGVDAEAFHPEARDADLRGLLGLPANTRLLAFAGRLAREKSIALMCAAVESLGAPYHLLLIGAREARRRSARVTELPYQDDARRLARVLASVDALLHAGQQETFGLVLIEAMACGRPVVGIRAGAVAELVDNRVGRLAESGCAESLAQAIVDLFDADIEQLGAEARRRVESGFTWHHVFTSQLARYARIMRGQTDVVSAPSLAEQLP
jgi:alpha-1,6-mannosyltransferase